MASQPTSYPGGLGVRLAPVEVPDRVDQAHDPEVADQVDREHDQHLDRSAGDGPEGHDEAAQDHDPQPLGASGATRRFATADSHAEPDRTVIGPRCTGECGSSGVPAYRWWSRCTAAQDSGSVPTMTLK